ncbi:MAG TPA: hypothetical protein VLF94_04050 [Chlamydiales bacterium]|nr:hypothetical protein [Chlamydiales bacterium]
MKIRLALVAILLLSPIFGKEKNFPEIRQVVALTELDSAFIDEFAVGKYPDIVIECKEGTTLPFSLLYSRGPLSLKWTPNLTVKVDQLYYVRCLGKKAYVSRDLVTWEKANKLMHGKETAKVKIDAQSGIFVDSKLVPYADDADDNDSIDWGDE